MALPGADAGRRGSPPGRVADTLDERRLPGRTGPARGPRVQGVGGTDGALAGAGPLPTGPACRGARTASNRRIGRALPKAVA